MRDIFIVYIKCCPADKGREGERRRREGGKEGGREGGRERKRRERMLGLIPR